MIDTRCSSIGDLDLQIAAFFLPLQKNRDAEYRGDQDILDKDQDSSAKGNGFRHVFQSTENINEARLAYSHIAYCNRDESKHNECDRKRDKGRDQLYLKESEHDEPDLENSNNIDNVCEGKEKKPVHVVSGKGVEKRPDAQFISFDNNIEKQTAEYCQANKNQGVGEEEACFQFFLAQECANCPKGEDKEGHIHLLCQGDKGHGTH